MPVSIASRPRLHAIHMTVTSDLDHLGEGVFVRFVHCSITPCPPLHTILLGKTSPRVAHTSGVGQGRPLAACIGEAAAREEAIPHLSRRGQGRIRGAERRGD